MRVIIWIFSFILVMIGGLTSILYIKTDFRPLETDEIVTLKANKAFWEWHSPYGKLDVHFDEKGNGQNHVLFLHGYRSHTFTWRHLLEPLSKAGFHVWALDLVGFGISDKPNHVPYTPEFFLEQINAFMKSHGIESAHLVGNSLGGGLALNLALNRPEAVQSLTLINPLGFPLEIPFYIAVGRYFESIWIPFLGPTTVREGLKNAIYKCERISDEQVQAYCLPYQLPGGITSSLITMRQFSNQWLSDMMHQYSSLTQPILLIWGMQDNILPSEHYEQFTDRFPHADKEPISSCGHLPQEEEPEQVLTAIATFLGSISIPNDFYESYRNQQKSRSNENFVEGDLKKVKQFKAIAPQEIAEQKK